MKLSSLAFFAKLKWIDGTPLLQHVEPYRQRLFTLALDSGQYNLVLAGRSKKNYKSTDLVLAALYCLLTDSGAATPNQCYLLANDLDQAGDDLALAKLLIDANPLLSRHLVVKQRIIERRDARGFLMILPAGDIAGSHGKTYRFAGWDEIHGYKSWDILEALQPDPHRRDALQWITTYASMYHRPGIPLFDMFQQGQRGSDPRMLFSWYSGSFATDPDTAALSAEEQANPSRGSWADPTYLLQQQQRLPSHVYRRLHLCEPGLPEGSAFAVEPVLDAIQRGTRQRLPEPGCSYVAFVDPSGGSSDDFTLGIAHLDPEGRAILDLVCNQGTRCPFDPRLAVGKFAGVLKQYNIAHIALDRYAGLTFQFDFQGYGISSEVALLSASEIYVSFEPVLNGGRAVLLDVPQLEQQLLGLIWKGGKITHPNNEHDDWANAALGALLLALQNPQGDTEAELVGAGEVPEEELAEDNFLRGW